VKCWAWSRELELIKPNKGSSQSSRGVRTMLMLRPYTGEGELRVKCDFEGLQRRRRKVNDNGDLSR
jgi:hypothetical protein